MDHRQNQTKLLVGNRRCNCPFVEPIHIYAGAGYFERNVSWELTNGEYYGYDPDSYNGIAVDLGIMLKVKRFFINAGTTYGFSLGGDYDGDKAFVGNFGIGMYF